VLVIAGGDWCRWCLALDKFVSDDPEVKTSLDAAFVTVHAYYGDENENQAFFSRLPEADGYPHFWVLDSDGGLIRSVSTAGLEDGDDGYNKAAFLEFIRANRATH
jgi:hypothetical protein